MSVEQFFLYGGMVRGTFDSDKHRYTVALRDPDGNYGPEMWTPSVTSMPGFIDNGSSAAFKQWAANLAASYFRDRLLENRYQLDEVSLPRIYQAARFAHKNALGDAANAGTAVHAYIEQHIRHQLGKDDAPEKPINEQVQAGVEAFLDWERKVNPTYLFSERRIYSVRHHVSGTADIGAEIGGKRKVVDVKTSKSIRENYYIQLSAYLEILNEEDAMLEGEDHQPWEERIILHVDKENGTFKDHNLDVEMLFGGKDSWTHERCWEAFLAARQAYRIYKEWAA